MAATGIAGWTERLVIREVVVLGRPLIACLGMRSALVSAWLCAGCLGTGSLELELTLPTDPDLKPTGMTTITVLATSPEIDPVANRATLNGSRFSAGDLPVANKVQINVLLNDVSNRLVGLGEAPELVDIKGDRSSKLSIPVRKPFIYAASGAALYTFDPTLDPRNMKFQGKLSGLTTPSVPVSVGGDELVVAGGSQLQIIDTATHKVTGSPISIGGGTINDVAPVPSAKKVAVAHSGGIAIVDLETGAVANAAVGAVDRVTVGPAADGRMVVYGLIGRVAPPDTPLVACSGSSSVVAVFVDSPNVATPKPLASGVSAIAAAPSQPAVFAAVPCAGQIARIDGDPTSETAPLMLTKMADLGNAAAIAVLGDRVYGAGTRASVPQCASGTSMVACTTSSSTACPETGGNHVAWVADGAHLVVQSVPIAGGAPVTLELPERRETMVDTDDEAKSHAQVMHPLGTVPLDLVVLPGGQYVSVVTKNSYFIESLFDTLNNLYILPCIKTVSSDWVLVDLASSSIAQRVRTSCMITAIRTGGNVYFPNWACDAPPEGERNTQGGDYVPTAVGALFGAR